MNEKFYQISTEASDNQYLRLVINGQQFQLAWEDCSSRLANATPAQRLHMEVSPSGYGIHWPEIDEDLAVKPLLELAQKTRQLAEKKPHYK